MKVKILNHREINKGVKEVTGVNIYTNDEVKLTLTDKSYSNFIRYVMRLWNDNLKSSDIITKVVNSNTCYCFYKV